MFSFATLYHSLFRRRQFEEDLTEELSAYADLLTEENLRRGMKPEVARRAALLEIGGVEQVKENVRESRLVNFADGLAKDLRHSLRSMARTPGTTVLAIATLALGLGAATLIFSIFYSILLAPFPFREPSRLVQMWETRTGVTWSRASFAAANFWDVRALNRTFESVAGYSPADVNLVGFGEPQHLSAAKVSAQFFRTLGVRPIIGHDFDDKADQPEHENGVALLSQKFWRSRFSSSDTVLGSTLHLNGSPYKVIGVVPAGEPWLNDADVYLPLVYSPQARRGSFEVSVIGRLASGISLPVAEADLTRIAHHLSEIYRQDRGMGVLVSPSSVWGAQPVLRRALAVLLGAVALLLLIACVNVANLLLAKATARSRELRIREALGASRGRLVRLALTESLSLAACGAALGLFLANWGLALLRASTIQNVPRLSEVEINSWVLGVALFVTVLSAVLSGLAPALQTSSSNLATVLREDDRSQTAGLAKSRLRSALVSSEVALSMVLLIGAGLLIRSFNKLLNVDRGFSTSSRTIATLNMPTNFGDARAERFTSSLLERVRALGGVEAAATVNSKPIVGWDPGMGLGAQDSPPAEISEVPWASWRYISTGYFHAMGIELLAGRDFTSNDFLVTSTRRVLISAAVANLFWPSQNPIGRQIVLWKGQSNRAAEVIGVVANTRDHGLDADPTRIVYLPMIGQTYSPVQLILKSSYTPASLSSALRPILSAIEPGIPVSKVQAFDSLIAESLGSRRFNLFLLSSFALLALLLSLTGIYGVLAYSIARRTQEIGIRLALGASSASILALIFRQGMRPILIGMVPGTLVSLALTQTLRRLLFQVQPLDFTTYLAVALLVVTAGAVACYLPARRALRVDPIIALREQ